LEALELRQMLAGHLVVTADGAPVIVSGQAAPVKLAAAIVGGSSFSGALQFHNDGDAPVSISEVTFGSASAFGLRSDRQFPIEVSPGFDVFLLPVLDTSSPGLKTAQVVIRSDDPAQPSFTFPVQALVYGGAGDRDLGVLGSTPVVDTADLHFASAGGGSTVLNPGVRVLRFDIDQPRANVGLSLDAKAANVLFPDEFPSTTVGVFADSDGDGQFSDNDARSPVLLRRSVVNSDPAAFQSVSGDVELNRGTYFIQIDQSPPENTHIESRLEGTYTLTARATAAAAPKLEVRGKGVLIAADDDTPSTGDGTDLGTARPGQAAVGTFTLKNSGTAPLKITGVSTAVNGGDALTVSGLPSELAAGASATITVRFKLLGRPGRQISDFTIASDDPENPFYHVGLQATFVAPPLAIVDPAGGFRLNDPFPLQLGTNTAGGAAAVKTIRLQNVSGAALLLGRATVGAGFVIVQDLPTAAVPANGFAEVKVRPDDTAGEKAAALSFTTRPAAGGVTDTFTINLAATVNPAASEDGLVVLGDNGLPVTRSDDTPSVLDGTDLGKVAFGSTLERTLHVVNNGSRAVVLEAPSPGGDAQLVSPTGSTFLDPGQSVDVVIRFDTGRAGPISGSVSLAGFTAGVAYAGEVLPSPADANPLATLESVRGAPFLSLPSINFGTMTSGGASAVRTFRVRNTSNVAVYYDKVVAGGDFIVIRQIPWRLEPGQVGEFDIRMDSSVGAKSGTVSFSARRVSGDRTPQFFSYDLTGTSVAPPTGGLLVRGHGFYPIASGDDTTSTADDTDFGTVPRGGTITRTFELKNTGAVNLIIDSVGQGFTGGSGPGSLVPRLEVLPLAGATTIRPNGTARITVKFYTSSGVGDAFDGVSVNYHAAGEPESIRTYSFVVGGTVSGPNVDLIAVSTNGPFTLPFPFGTIPFGQPAGPSRLYSDGIDPALETFQVINRGSKPVTLGKVTLGGAGAAGFRVERQPGQAMLKPGETTTFDVRLLSSAAGDFVADVLVPIDGGAPLVGKISGSVVGDRATHAFGTDSSLEFRNDIDPIGFTPRKPGIDVSSFSVDERYGATYVFTLSRATPPAGQQFFGVDQLAPVAFNLYQDTNGNGKLDDGKASMLTLTLARNATRRRVSLPFALKKGKYLIALSVNGVVSSDRTDVLIPAKVTAPPPAPLSASKIEVRDPTGVLVPEASTNKVLDLKGARSITLLIRNAGGGYLDFTSEPTATGGFTARLPKKASDASVGPLGATTLVVSVPATAARGSVLQGTVTLTTNDRTVTFKVFTKVA
jgi:hypothetical protein